MMEPLERKRLIKQILWDYSIPVEDVEALLKGEREMAGHYTREMIFQKIIESYPWFTVIQLFKPQEIKELLTHQVIGKLRSPSLRQKYEFVRNRLHETLPASG